MICFLNGQFLDLDDAAISFNSGGHLYGYGAFETLLVYHNKAPLLDLHLNRLLNTLSFLKLDTPSQWNDIASIIEILCKKNTLSAAKANIYVSAGSRTSLFEFNSPHFCVVLSPLTQLSSLFGITFKPDPFGRTILDQFKTQNYLKSILIRKQFPQFNEVILYNSHNQVLEGSTHSVFFIQNNTLVLPKADFILNSISSQVLQDLAKKLNMKVGQRPVLMSELNHFDEIFVSNAVSGVVEVHQNETVFDLISKEKTLLFKEAWATRCLHD